MKIHREGKEFVLTAEELVAAYYEQQRNFDLDNIRENMGSYLEDYEYEILKDNVSFIEAAAIKLRSNQDAQDMGYGDSLNDAFESAKEPYKAQLSALDRAYSVDYHDPETVKEAVWSLLEHAKIDSGRKLDVNSVFYQKAMELSETFCHHFFPELFDTVFGSQDNDLVFKDGSKDDYSLFYYNPDSSAGGQIVQCTFSESQAIRMVNNPVYLDVLAENTQYLSDINDLCFFEDIFSLVELKENGQFLGDDANKAFLKIRSEREAGQGDKVAAATQCLIDNGIAPDEAETVLQALGYILMDTELFPEEKKNKASLSDMIRSASSRTAVKASSEAMEYDRGMAERCSGLGDVLTPQECADLFGKPVKDGNSIYFPKQQETDFGR